MGLWKGTDARSREIYEWALQSFDLVKIPSIRVGSADQGDADQSLTRLHDTLEGVFVRSGNSRSTQLQKDFAKAMEPVEDLVREVLSESVNSVATELPFQDPVLGVDLSAPQHALRGMLREAVITSHDDVVVPIAERGTGFQSALVLGILRYVSSKSRQAGWAAWDQPMRASGPCPRRTRGGRGSDEAVLLEELAELPVLEPAAQVAAQRGRAGDLHLLAVAHARRGLDE